jgi:hypothetical protein
MFALGLCTAHGAAIPALPDGYYRLKFIGSRRRIGRYYNDLEKILAIVA